MSVDAAPVDALEPSERFLPSRGVSVLSVGAILLPVLIGPPIRWAMGASDLSFLGSVGLAIVLAVVVLPLALFAWRRLRRPQLLIGPHVLEEVRGQTVWRVIPRAEVRSVEVRPFLMSGQLVARSVMIGLRSGDHVHLTVPDDLCLPGLRENRFDERVQFLRDWARLPAPPEG